METKHLYRAERKQVAQPDFQLAPGHGELEQKQTGVPLAQGLPPVKFTGSVWRQYRASFCAGLDKLLALSPAQYQALLGRVRLSSLGLGAENFDDSAELRQTIDFWTQHWQYYFLFPKEVKIPIGRYLKQRGALLSGSFFTSNEGARCPFVVSDDLRSLPADSSWQGGQLTFRQVLFGQHEGSIEGCDGNTRPFRECLFRHASMFLRYPDDITKYAIVLNDLVDAVCAAGKTRHQTYTRLRGWLLGGEDPQGRLRSPFGAATVSFVLQQGLFSDRGLSTTSAQRTKENRTQKMQNQHAIHESKWLAWLDNLYQAVLAQATGLQPAPNSPFSPGPDRPVWALQACFLMAALGMRGIEVCKFSGLAQLSADQAKLFTHLAASKHVSQVGQAKKGWLTYDPPEDGKGEWTLSEVAKPIALLTADAHGVLAIFRDMRRSIDLHLTYRAENSGGRKLRPEYRPPSDFGLSASSSSSSSAPPAAKKQKTAVSAWARRVLDRPAGTSAVQSLSNAEAMQVLDGAGLDKTFDYLMQNYAQFSGDKPLPNKHLLRALYGEVSYALYGEGSLVSRPLFLSRVLAHANNDLNSQLFYQTVFLVRRETPLLEVVNDVNVKKLLADLVEQSKRLAEQYRQALSAQPAPPPAAAVAPAESKSAALKRRAVAFFRLHQDTDLEKLRSVAFWRGANQYTFPVGPATRFAGLVNSLLEKSAPVPQLSTMFSDLI